MRRADPLYIFHRGFFPTGAGPHSATIDLGSLPDTLALPPPLGHADISLVNITATQLTYQVAVPPIPGDATGWQVLYSAPGQADQWITPDSQGRIVVARSLGLQTFSRVYVYDNGRRALPLSGNPDFILLDVDVPDQPGRPGVVEATATAVDLSPPLMPNLNGGTFERWEYRYRVTETGPWAGSYRPSDRPSL